MRVVQLDGDLQIKLLINIYRKQAPQHPAVRKNGCETNRWLLGGSYHSHSVSSWQLWLVSPRFLGLFTSQMAFLWLMNGGDPNHLRYLGRPFKYFGTYPVGWWAPGKSSRQQKIKESKGVMPTDQRSDDSIYKILVILRLMIVCLSLLCNYLLAIVRTGCLFIAATSYCLSCKLPKICNIVLVSQGTTQYGTSIFIKLWHWQDIQILCNSS